MTSGRPDDRADRPFPPRTPGPSDTGSTGSTDATLAIGSVLAALTPDFPDLTISKIRYLEAEGLVTPARTGSGYRKYTTADVERLRYILTAQQRRFWPLKVIREALDAMDRGLTPPGVGPGDSDGALPAVPDAGPDPAVPSAEQLTAAATLRLTARELRDAAGIDRPTLDSLESFGLVTADSSGHFDNDALTVARVAGQLATYGVEPRHLRAFRTAADREIGLVQQIVAPTKRAQQRRTSSAAGEGSGTGAGAGEPVADPTPHVLRMCIALHVALVRSGLPKDDPATYGK